MSENYVSELDIFYLLEATQKFEARLNLALMYFGLRLPQYRVLDVLDKSGKITVSDLSRNMNVSRATMSVLIAKLQKSGLIESLDNRLDKRSFYLLLTPAGLAKFKSAEAAVNLVRRNLEQTLTAESIVALNDFSRHIKRSRLD